MNMKINVVHLWQLSFTWSNLDREKVTKTTTIDRLDSSTDILYLESYTLLLQTRVYTILSPISILSNNT